MHVIANDVTSNEKFQERDGLKTVIYY